MDQIGTAARKRKSISLEQRIADTRGHASGFDYERIILSVAVVFWHSFTTSYGNGFAYDFLTTPYRPIVAVLVPMFFALSGFLVAASLFRNTIVAFICNRAFRIVPALAVETILSAFLLGAWLTTTPHAAYFRSPVFFKYLGNIVGWIHYQLPGVFLTNPVANKVNGQLWTVPWELYCYAALLIGRLFRIVRSRALFVGLTIFATIGLLVFELLIHHGHMDQENGVAAPALLMAFLSAVSIYLYRDKLLWSGWWFLASTVVLIGLFLVPGGDYLIGFPAAYATIYLGLHNPPKIGLIKSADYSYGLYIYHYVIQQAFVYLVPTQRHWFVVFPVTIVLGGIFAAISWHWIEKPALRGRAIHTPLERFFAGFAPKRSV